MSYVLSVLVASDLNCGYYGIMLLVAEASIVVTTYESMMVVNL